ncbi:MAG: hypothetical protein JWQ70_3000 [Aeromicrobium sp.]|nr:hypothetical protein [Aeromicrobium sp.]
MKRLAAVAFALGLSLTACGGSSSDAGHAKATSSPSDSPYPTPSLGPLGAPGCHPASPLGKYGEVQGTPTEPGATLYGLMQITPEQRLGVGMVLKFVWRMPGENLVLHAIGPDGSVRSPTWGPEEHGGSTFHRPGNEWGTGIKFTKPGCWELRMSTDTSHASVWLKVKS